MVRKWVSETKLAIPAASLMQFEKDVLEALSLYVAAASKPTSNQIHHEIDALVRAALRASRARKRPDAAGEKVAVMVERLSAPALRILGRRGTLPGADALRDPATQRDACEAVARLGRMGAYWDRDGRGRSGGKQSTTEVSVLYAPRLQERPLRHEAEHELLTLLENAHLRATGELPPATAHRDRPSAFAEFLQAFLDAIESDADAIELLSERQRRRRTKQRQEVLRALLRRWENVVDGIIERLSGPKS